MALYTKTGDDGTTGLFGGSRVSKDEPRIAAVGTVDELNSVLGLALCAAAENKLIRDILTPIQSRLFELGADLATPRSVSPETVPRIGQAHVAELEKWIDEVSRSLPELRQFVLPGGSELSARLHVARTVCRRAERACVALGRKEKLEPGVVVYLNRLGDLLFALARWANQVAGVKDVPWVQPTPFPTSPKGEG